MKKQLSAFLAFSLMMSFIPGRVFGAEANEQVYTDLSVNSDLFIKTTHNATSKYDLTQWYYDGSGYGEYITMGDLKYKFHSSGYDTTDNDVIKINTTDVTVDVNECATKTLGLAIVSQKAEEDIVVKVNYEGGATESYNAKVKPMNQATDTNTGKNPLKVVRTGSRFIPTADTATTVYLHDVVLDLSKSVNKNLNVESVTISEADVDCYLMAVTQVKFSDEEINGQTQEAVKNLLDKYVKLDFVDLAEKKDGAKIEEAEELYSAMLKQQATMPEVTEEKLERIEKLIAATKLYASAKALQQNINDNIGDYPTVSTDFDVLEDTELTNADYQKLLQLVEDYDSYGELDLVKLENLTEWFGISEKVDVSINEENEEKVRALLTAYEKAKTKTEILAKIDALYDDYKDKDISEITASDLTKLESLISYFDEADEKNITLEGYNGDYIRHLYNDYDKFKNSEERTAIDITKYYNRDMLAEPGEVANADTWYENSDNLKGSKFLDASHGYMKGYDRATSIMTLGEYEYVEKTTTDENTGISTTKYPFTATGNVIPFYVPSACFSANTLDSLLLQSGSNLTYTMDLGGVYTDKLYMLVSTIDNCTIAPILTYVDGSTEEIKIKANSAGQTINQVRNQSNTYVDMVGAITSGDYKNYNRANNGTIYAADGNTTNGFSVFAIKADETKALKSVTFKSTTKDYLISGLSRKPAANEMIKNNAAELYGKLVKNGEVQTSNMAELFSLSSLLRESSRRGLYIDGVEKDVTEKIHEMILTAEGTIARYDLDTVRARVEFSTGVNESSLENAISVTANDKTVSDFTYQLVGKELTIDIPVSRNGSEELNVTIDGAALEKYPSVEMVYPYELSYEVPEYITIDYVDNTTLNIKNNSQTDTEYLAYAVVKDGDKITDVVTAEGSVSAGDKATAYLNIAASVKETSVVYAGVLNKQNKKPLAETVISEKTSDTTVKTADYKEPSLNLEKNIVTIQGITPSAKADKTVSAVIEVNSTVLYVGTVLTNKDGYFIFNVPVEDVKVPISSYLKITIGGEDFEKAFETSSLYFPKSDLRKEAVNGLKNAADYNAVLTILQNADKSLALNFAPFAEIMANSSDALAKRVYAVKNEIQSISESDSQAVVNEKIKKAQDIIKQQAILECISEKKTDKIALNNEFLYDDVMKYSSIDSDGVTLYEIYENGISEAGKKAIADTIIGKDYKDTNALLNDFAKAIMLNALKNPAQKGVGHVAKALTRQNAQLVGMTITKYLNLTDKSTADSYIANMSISSLSDVENYIKQLSDGSSSKDNGSSSSSSSSSSGGSGIIAAAPQTEVISKPNTESNLFNDVNKAHWAYNAIKALAEKKILNGKGNGNFAPNDTITRAEFVKIICIVKNLEAGSTETTFDDVNAKDWFAPYVAAAYKAGFVNGVDKNNFAPNSTVSRQDICTLIYRMDKSDYAGEAKFADKADIAQYAQNAVAYCFSKKIVSGFEDNTFKPASGCTRAQAATIIYNYLNN